MRRRITRDKNHAEIVDALQKHGVDVLDLSTSGGGVADIVTHHRQKTVFIEIKCGPRAELKKTQVRFLALWSGHCGIVRTIDEAVALATDPVSNALTDPQKDKLAVFYGTMQTPKVHLNTILKAINT